MPKSTQKKTNGASLGFEQTLWQAADKMRNNMDASEYKHVVLGLIFLKYVSDAFAEKHNQLLAEKSQGADPEDRDEYRADNVFWVPPSARWSHLQANAKQPTIGRLIDDAMVAIEHDNPNLKGVLPKDYARATLDKQRLGELIDLIGTIGLGDKDNRSKDILGRVYEYFLSQFASAEGKKGGQFYTPRSVVRVLVEMIEPYKGRIYDPCCGSGGMFVQSEKFVEAHGGRIGDISIFGQESNPTTWKLAKMNMAIRGIDINLGPKEDDSFLRDLHPDLKADFILANPPFNMSDWGGERLREDARWKFGVPPTGNANFAWVQHFIHHLSPTGIAGFVLANGSMSSNTSGEGEIRKAIIEAGLVDCMVSMPGQLFYSTQIPVCLWFLRRKKVGATRPGPENVPAREVTLPDDQFASPNGSFVGATHAVPENKPASKVTLPDDHSVSPNGSPLRNDILFIDARKMGTLTDRVHREMTDADITRIADTYHAWRDDRRGDPSRSIENSDTTERVAPTYEDIPGFCKSVTLDEVRAQGYVLTPGRYVGAEDIEDEDEKFEEKLSRMVKEVENLFDINAKLEERIKSNLQSLVKK